MWLSLSFRRRKKARMLLCIFLAFSVTGISAPRRDAQDMVWWKHATNDQRSVFVTASTAALSTGYMSASWYIASAQSKILPKSLRRDAHSDPIIIAETAPFPDFPESTDYYVGLINRAYELGRTEDPLYILLCTSNVLDWNTSAKCYQIDVQLHLRKP
ncbi:MAG TPA: hypothetical protein VNF68_04920 [Candidatus Baltobacteraceae bacterium]|nr:hypothetical protein [Candidatus Baltobacteraceae bacterium]